MEWIICPVSGCGKKIKNLKLHYRSSHPDLDVPDLRKPALDQYDEFMRTHQEQSKEQSAQELSPELPQEPAAEAPQSDLLQKLKVFGIDPNDIIIAFTPLIETSVVKMLEKMQLGEAINKKMADVEAKLGEKIQPLVDMGQQLQAGRGGQSSGDSQPVQQGDALRDQVLPLLLQKFLNPKSGGDSVNLESMAKTLEAAKALSDIFSKPYMEGQAAARREMNETIKLMSGLGATPEQKQKALAAGN